MPSRRWALVDSEEDKFVLSLRTSRLFLASFAVNSLLPAL